MGKELFKNIPSKVGDLVKDVRNGRIGLPDLQRPFVWKDNKVRELFDSMLKGYPIGYIMLWESPADYESKKSSIGNNDKTYDEPKELVIDGQQRLTTFVILLNEIVEYSRTLKENGGLSDRDIVLGYETLEDVVSKYICQHRPPNKQITTYLFGYEVDNPSSDYLQ